ncbi:MAG: HNH endonuclease [Planctomycetes bacterium]|nr:HNH endonuclease [Planctomycetota bacterium]
MPYRPKTHLQRQREQRPQRGREGRLSAARRGYGWRWRKLRMMVLRRDPFCKWPGCHDPSTDADHIIPKRDGGDDSFDNLQGLCAMHHSQKTRRGE